MRRGAALAGVLAALTVPSTAQAQIVQAVDGTDANNYENTWSPKAVTVKPGETVTWSFSGSAVYHNVVSASSNWSFRNGDPAIAPPPASHTFSTPGTYRFVCQIHQTTMVGDVIVTDASGNPPPPPPPPPLSEQPFPNTTRAPAVFEVDDVLAPRLTRVTARSWRQGARVRFRIDEPAVVTLRAKRAGLTVKRTRALVLKGTRTTTMRGLRAGTYKIEVVARDLAGNRSRVKRARVTVR